MSPGSEFKEIIEHSAAGDISHKEVIILCAGKFVYDIYNIMNQSSVNKTALFSIE